MTYAFATALCTALLLAMTSEKPAASAPAAATSGTLAASTGEVVVVGASYAAGWTDLQLAGYGVTNLGQGGAETADMLAVARGLEKTSARHPQVVLVWGFINDLQRSPPQSWPATRERIKAHWLEIISVARRMGATVVLATEVTIRHPAGVKNDLINFAGGMLGKRSYQNVINDEVMNINGWIRELGARDGLLVLDQQRILSDASGYRLRRFAQPDGSHLPEEAYRALTANAQPLIAARLGPGRR